MAVCTLLASCKNIISGVPTSGPCTPVKKKQQCGFGDFITICILTGPSFLCGYINSMLTTTFNHCWNWPPEAVSSSTQIWRRSVYCQKLEGVRISPEGQCFGSTLRPLALWEQAEMVKVDNIMVFSFSSTSTMITSCSWSQTHMALLLYWTPWNNSEYHGFV